MAEANRFLEELFWPAHNARFARPAADTGSAFVAFAGTLEEPPGTASSRATMRYKNRTLSRPIATATTSRRRSVHEYPDARRKVSGALTSTTTLQAADPLTRRGPT